MGHEHDHFQRDKALKILSIRYQTWLRAFVLFGFITSVPLSCYYTFATWKVQPLLALASIVTFLMAFLSYLVATITHPGNVPKDWDDPDAEYPYLNRTTQKLPVIRFCLKCDAMKPPRVHHCSICGHCVPKMDHHCVWIANCVGYRNHKAFVLFLFYQIISNVLTLIYMILRLISILSEEKVEVVWGIPLFMNAYLFILCTFSLSFVLYVMSFQKDLVLKNSTSMEELRMSTMNYILRRKVMHYPYDHGVMNNLRTFLGENKLLWLIPTVQDGHSQFYDKISPLYRVKVYNNLERF